MTVIPFTGPSYQYNSLNFDAQRSVNQYRIKSETKTSKQPDAMQGTPGLSLFSALGPDPVRGGRVVNGRCFFVAGLFLYEVLSTGAPANKGMLKTQYGPVAMNDNGLQLMIVDGANGYILQLATTQNQIRDGTFDSANIITNGTFSSDTGWTKGAGWTITGGAAVATGAISTPITQTDSGMVSQSSYIVTYTVTVTAGSITPNIGGTVGTARTASGTYTEILIAGASSVFSFTTSGFTGTVDNVSATPVDINWTQGAGWSIANNVATATNASAPLSQTVSLKNGVPYAVTYTITASAGSITPYLAGTLGTTRTASGTYTDTITAASGTTFEFDTSGFSGTVDNVSVTQPNDAFLNITDPGFLGSTTIAFIDGYFILNKPGTSIYYLSNSYDGTSYDALMFEQVEGFTDNINAVCAVHNQLWLFGATGIEIYYDSGGTDTFTFPFSSISGTLIEYGSGASQSVQVGANTVFWLGGSKQGIGTVWMAEGYQPTKISTDAVEYAIQSYGDVSGAVGYTYEEGGHWFYCINFPSAPTTWCYDIGMQEWHERAYFNLTTGQFERHRAQCHVYAFGMHLVGDYLNGNIYQQSLSIYNDNGNPIRRLRAAPHLADDLERVFYDEFQLDMETGVGLTTGGIQDTAPQIALQWSDDGGYTWSNEHWRPVAAIGNYKARVIWRRLGKARDRIFRTIYTANTKYFVIAAHAKFRKGVN